MFVEMMSGPRAPLSLAFRWCGWRVLHPWDYLLGSCYDLRVKENKQAAGEQMQQATAVGGGRVRVRSPSLVTPTHHHSWGGRITQKASPSCVVRQKNKVAKHAGREDVLFLVSLGQMRVVSKGELFGMLSPHRSWTSGCWVWSPGSQWWSGLRWPLDWWWRYYYMNSEGDVLVFFDSPVPQHPRTAEDLRISEGCGDHEFHLHFLRRVRPLPDP